jgi:hypothetical protein
MKIISYNIGLSNHNKIEQLFKHYPDADIYVIPEIELEEKEKLPVDFEMEWHGIRYSEPFMGTNSKGLGIIWRKGKGKVLEYDKSLKYAIPLEYEKKIILAFWPTKEKTNGTYTKIAESIIDKYRELFENEEVIITGDFNLYYKPPVRTYSSDIFAIINKLQPLGFKSIYHASNNTKPGFEKQYTYFFRNKTDQPFFLDYTFTNIPIENFKYELKDLGRDFSDHAGQIIEF